ncbi:MAG: tRNA pseudouridine(55) synthase TruB [Hirschia sp.]|nr:tRNA pseudouridine(55) synthase TruB [Hirschia sp.]MBF18626.1 tRNA pseudouridine(55) synthase TruB [Hirschia sp.]
MGRKRKKGLPVNGWLILDKPDDITSTQAVGKTRWLLNAQKAGHGGTLDPLADGILPIAFGEATKTVPFVMEADKDYRFTIRWGSSTTTQDREGDVIAESDVRPTKEAIETALAGMIGEIDQVPPQFSAIKVDGERAYDLARDGQEVILESRKVHLFDARLESTPSEDLAVISVTCGKGFYIRALVRDLAAHLGAEGHVAALRRTRVGAFAESDSISLAMCEEIGDRDALEAKLVPIETALDDIPALAINGDEAFRLRQGREIVLLPHQVEAFQEMRRPRIVNGEDMSRICLAMEQDKAVALGEVRAGRFKPVRVFNL